MSDAKHLKSQYELALERFKQEDQAEGVEHKAPTEAQKAEIAEIRNLYDAKIAEIDVLFNGRQMTGDPAEQAAREEEHRRDRARLAAERDTKVEQVRRGEA